MEVLVAVLEYPRKFNWYRIPNDGDGTTANDDVTNLLDFLITDLGLPNFDKTDITRFQRREIPGPGRYTEEITFFRGGGTPGVGLYLAADKSIVDVKRIYRAPPPFTSGDFIGRFTARDSGDDNVVVYVDRNVISANKFCWNNVAGASSSPEAFREVGTTTTDDTVKLLDFLITDLGLPNLDRTRNTVIEKTIYADGMEAITVWQFELGRAPYPGTIVQLKLPANKSRVDVTVGIYPPTRGPCSGSFFSYPVERDCNEDAEHLLDCISQ